LIPGENIKCGFPTERPIDCGSWPFGVPESPVAASGYAPAASCRITQRVAAASCLEEDALPN